MIFLITLGVFVLIGTHTLWRQYKSDMFRSYPDA